LHYAEGERPMTLRGRGRGVKRGARWWIAYYYHGNEHREPAGVRLRDAQDLLHRRLSAAQEGRVAGRRVNVNALLDPYVADLTFRGKKSVDKIVSHLKPVRAA